jgi:hypothetical protein
VSLWDPASAARAALTAPGTDEVPAIELSCAPTPCPRVDGDMVDEFAAAAVAAAKASGWWLCVEWLVVVVVVVVVLVGSCASTLAHN